jgi:large subunit ribosomal protein L2
MPLVKVKPTSPGRRALVKVVNPELHKGDPFWPLTQPQKRGSGRNNYGRVTTRHQGGGHKHHLRVIDFRRNKDGIAAKVERLEYDPNRSAHVALLLYADGERRYVIAPKGVTVGTQLMSGPEAPIKPGNALPLRNIPIGTEVHCVEMLPGKGAQLARSAGSHVQVLAKAPTRSCGCARARSARCTSTVAPPSARQATPSTTWNRSARPVACAGAACARRCAAWR